MATDLVLLSELAANMGMDRSHALKLTKKLGVQRLWARAPGSGNQLAVALTKADADRVLHARKQAGYQSRQSHELASVDAAAGFFYVIQLVPDLDPNRVKLGFTSDLNSRLIEHRTTCPTAQYAKTFPCKRGWEATIMQLIVAGAALEWIGGEVFKGNLDAVNAYLEKLLPIMPQGV